MSIEKKLNAINEIVEKEQIINNVQGELKEIPVEEIIIEFSERSNEENMEDDTDFAELVASIKEVGLIQPVVVLKTSKGYKKIAGGRRIRAFKILGKETIPAYVIDEDDIEDEFDVYKMMLDENSKRKGLNKNEQVEILLKVIAVEFNQYDVIPESETLIEEGKKILKTLDKIVRKKTPLTEEEGKLLNKWKQFENKFNIKLRTLIDDVAIYTLIKPLRFYYDNKLINKKTALKISSLLKDNKPVWLLLELEMKKLINNYDLSDGNQFEEARKELNKLINEIISNKKFINEELKKLKNQEINKFPELGKLPEELIYRMIAVKFKNEEEYENLILKILEILENINDLKTINQEILNTFLSIETKEKSEEEENLEKKLKAYKTLKNVERKLKRNIAKLDVDKIEEVYKKLLELDSLVTLKERKGNE